MSFSPLAREIVNPSRVGFNDGRYYSNTSDYFNEEAKQEDLIGLLKDLKALYEDAKADKTSHDVLVKLSDDSAEFPAHKQILIARSSAFEALFNGETIPSITVENDVITLDDTFKEETVEFLMNYIYWGYIDELRNEGFAKDIFKKASLLDLKQLRRSVGDDIYNKYVNVENALEILELAEECGCKHLKKNVIDYIVAHKNEVTTRKYWDEFAKNNSKLIKEIYENAALQK